MTSMLSKVSGESTVTTFMAYQGSICMKDMCATPKTPFKPTPVCPGRHEITSNGLVQVPEMHAPWALQREPRTQGGCVS